MTRQLGLVSVRDCREEWREFIVSEGAGFGGWSVYDECHSVCVSKCISLELTGMSTLPWEFGSGSRGSGIAGHGKDNVMDKRIARVGVGGRFVPRLMWR